MMGRRTFEEFKEEVNATSGMRERLDLIYKELFSANGIDYERDVKPVFGDNVLFVGKFRPSDAKNGRGALMTDVRLFGNKNVLGHPFVDGPMQVPIQSTPLEYFKGEEGCQTVFLIKQDSLRDPGALWNAWFIVRVYMNEESGQTPELDHFDEIYREYQSHSELPSLSPDAIDYFKLLAKRPKLREMIERTQDAREETRGQLEKFKEPSEGTGKTAEEPDEGATALTDISIDEFKKPLTYDYEDELIRQFLMSLCTTQITMLCGEPGTGKTTFATEMAHALGAKLTTISVQNNWTDSSDLLGYYNPMDKTYYGTEFLEATIAARRDWDKAKAEYGHAARRHARLHIICLDEMNLSRIEYYFAEFLSKLQLKEGDRKLSLLPFMVGKSVDESPEGADDGTNPDALNELCDFVLPPNLRFVGTLNMDATTQSLSPKVIDRSLFIEFPKGGEAEEREAGEIESLESKFYPLSLFEPAGDSDVVPSGPEIKDEEDSKQSITSRVNGRLRRYAREMWPMFEKLSRDEDGPSELGTRFWNTIVLTKILPGLDTRDAAERLTEPFGKFRQEPTESQKRFDSKLRYRVGRSRGDAIHPYDDKSWSFWE